MLQGRRLLFMLLELLHTVTGRLRKDCAAGILRLEIKQRSSQWQASTCHCNFREKIGLFHPLEITRDLLTRRMRKARETSYLIYFHWLVLASHRLAIELQPKPDISEVYVPGICRALLRSAPTESQQVRDCLS